MQCSHYIINVQYSLNKISRYLSRFSGRSLPFEWRIKALIESKLELIHYEAFHATVNNIKLSNITHSKIENNTDIPIHSHTDVRLNVYTLTLHYSSICLYSCYSCSFYCNVQFENEDMTNLVENWSEYLRIHILYSKIHCCSFTSEIIPHYSYKSHYIFLLEKL